MARARALGPSTPSTSMSAPSSARWRARTSRVRTAPTPAIPRPAARIDRDEREVWMESPNSTRWRRVTGDDSSTSARYDRPAGVSPPSTAWREQWSRTDRPSSGRQDSIHWMRCTSDPSRAMDASTRAHMAIRES
jgi:hypothetical protein